MFCELVIIIGIDEFTISCPLLKYGCVFHNVLSTLFTSPTDFPGRYVGWDNTALALSPLDPLNTYVIDALVDALPASIGISRATIATTIIAIAVAFRHAVLMLSHPLHIIRLIL